MFDLKFHIDSLVEDCEACAKQYSEQPGLVQPATAVDLYKTIARLARIIRFAAAGSALEKNSKDASA